LEVSHTSRRKSGSKTSNSGRYEVSHYMVATGSMAWTGPPPHHKEHKEELVFLPLQLERTTGLFLMAGLEKSFQQVIGPLTTFMERSACQFDTVQFLTVADSATANLSMLSRFFSWLQEHSQKLSASAQGQQVPLVLSCFVPCLLHQMARVLVLNLQRQQLTNRMYCLTRIAQQSPMKRSFIRT